MSRWRRAGEICDSDKFKSRSNGDAAGKGEGGRGKGSDMKGEVCEESL